MSPVRIFLCTYNVRQKRQSGGKAQYVTKDVSWFQTSTSASTWYVRRPARGSGAAAGSLDVWFCFLLEQRGWEELSWWERKIRGEEESGVGKIGLLKTVKWTAVYQRLLY